MLKILSATWGYYGFQEDITQKIRDMVEKNELAISVDKDVLGDPCPYFVKDLKILYEHRGKMHNIFVQEQPWNKKTGRILKISKGKASTNDGRGLIGIKQI